MASLIELIKNPEVAKKLAEALKAEGLISEPKHTKPSTKKYDVVVTTTYTCKLCGYAKVTQHIATTNVKDSAPINDAQFMGHCERCPEMLERAPREKLIDFILRLVKFDPIWYVSITEGRKIDGISL